MTHSCPLRLSSDRPVDAEEGCKEGLLMELGRDLLNLPTAPDGTPAENDFLPGALQPCAVGSLAWSMAIAFRDSTGEIRADDIKPSSLQDFFDQIGRASCRERGCQYV